MQASPSTRWRRAWAVRIVPHLLAERDLAAGRVVATGEAVPSRMGYWLVAPLPQWRQQKVKALVEALGG